jgi:hypothetical protein
MWYRFDVKKFADMIKNLPLFKREFSAPKGVSLCR